MRHVRMQGLLLWMVVLVVFLAVGGFATRAEAQSVKTISTYAGGGPNLPGDGGPATGASLSSVGGIAVDGAGNVYIADFGTDRIRKVTAATGVITTIAGTGTAGNTR